MNLTTIIIYIAAAVLVIYGVYHTVQKIRGKAKSSCCGTPEMRTTVKVEDRDESHYPYKYILGVDGMKCSGCAANVENALNGMDGTWARVNLGKKQAKVLAKREYNKEDFEIALLDTSYRLRDFSNLNA